MPLTRRQGILLPMHHPLTFHHVVPPDVVDVPEERVVGVGQLVRQVCKRSVRLNVACDHGIKAIVGYVVEFGPWLEAGVLLLAEAPGAQRGERAKGGGIVALDRAPFTNTAAAAVPPLQGQDQPPLQHAATSFSPLTWLS